MFKIFSKYITFIIVPHEEVGQKSKQINYGVFYLGCVIAVAMMVFATYAFFNYRKNLSQRNHYEKLKYENLVLRERVENLRGSSDVNENAIKSILNSVDNLLVVNNLPPISSIVKEMGMGGIETLTNETVQMHIMDPMLKREIGKISTLIANTEKRIEIAERMLDLIKDNVRQNEEMWDNIPTNWPVFGWVTSGFGRRTSPITKMVEFHTGLDIAQTIGADVVAPGDGVVVYAGWRAGYGRTIDINHSYGIMTRYAHLDTIRVSVGQKVKKGEIIGTVGQTGFAVGPHLHYEVRVFGTPVDPFQYILTKKN